MHEFRYDNLVDGVDSIIHHQHVQILQHDFAECNDHLKLVFGTCALSLAINDSLLMNQKPRDNAMLHYKRISMYM